MNNLKPFLKWAGGKSQIIDKIKENIPETFNNYYEPFLGGGSVLFNIEANSVFANDINSQLINVYKQIKNNPKEFISKIGIIDSQKINKEYYYNIRDKFNQKIKSNILDLDSAAYFVFINKHCFNGLYRVNKNGLFNVPFNNSDVKSIDAENIYKVSSFLQNVSFSNTDYQVFLEKVACNDFVYIDSPYVPMSNTANFTNYAENGFSMENHKQLAKICKKLDKQNIKFLLSNNDTELVRKLYKDFNIISLDVNRSINSKGNNRKSKEVLVKNY